jgi:hypothetical protein
MAQAEGTAIRSPKLDDVVVGIEHVHGNLENDCTKQGLQRKRRTKRRRKEAKEI